MFQSLVSTHIPTQEPVVSAAMSKLLMPHPGQAEHMKLASPASSAETGHPSESSALPVSHMASPGSTSAAAVSPALPRSVAHLPRLPASSGLRIHIPEHRSFASPCPSPTGTIR